MFFLKKLELQFPLVNLVSKHGKTFWRENFKYTSTQEDNNDFSGYNKYDINMQYTLYLKLAIYPKSLI